MAFRIRPAKAGNSAQVSPPRRSELHGARAQVSKRPQSVRVCRTGVSRRQAEGELYRPRAQVSPSQRSESVKLRGNSTGRVSRNSTHAPSVPSAAFRIRPAKGELRPGVPSAAFRIRPAEGGLHRARAQVSKRPQSVRVCRMGVSRRQAITGNSTGHAPRCRLRSVCRARVRAVGARGGPGRCRAVKLKGNSTGPGRAGVSRRQAKGELHRAGARGCRAGVRAGARGCVAPSS